MTKSLINFEFASSFASYNHLTLKLESSNFPYNLFNLVVIFYTRVLVIKTKKKTVTMILFNNLYYGGNTKSMNRLQDLYSYRYYKNKINLNIGFCRRRHATVFFLCIKSVNLIKMWRFYEENLIIKCSSVFYRNETGWNICSYNGFDLSTKTRPYISKLERSIRRRNLKQPP